MARKPTFTVSRREEFLEHMRNGMRRGAAAEALGLSRKLVLDYIQDHEAYEILVLDAEGEATEHVEEALYQAAVSGSVPACKLWMDLRKPARSTALVLASEPTSDMDEELRQLMELTAED